MQLEALPSFVSKHHTLNQSG